MSSGWASLIEGVGVGADGVPAGGRTCTRAAADGACSHARPCPLRRLVPNRPRRQPRHHGVARNCIPRPCFLASIGANGSENGLLWRKLFDGWPPETVLLPAHKNVSEQDQGWKLALTGSVAHLQDRSSLASVLIFANPRCAGCGGGLCSGQERCSAPCAAPQGQRDEPTDPNGDFLLCRAHQGPCLNPSN